MAAHPEPLRLSLSTAHRLAAELKGHWRNAGNPDAAAALADHPSLARFKSIAIDLAYEEYCLREEAGHTPDVEEFCALFPHRDSLRKVLAAHRLLADEPERLDAPPAVGWPAPGETFEGLDLTGELGRGTFGRAYLAFDPGTNRSCVLKLTSGRTAEARVVGPLDHPHVTGVYWAKPVGGRSAVCMPLLGLTTLTEVRDAAFPDGPARRPRTADVILGTIHPDTPPGSGRPVVRAGEAYETGVAAIAARIADALAYLHSVGVAHGDLKPSNVVLGAGGHPYLIDFGLAVDGSAPAALRGGTLPYMAPEQLRVLFGDGRGAVDPQKADLYSFGVLLYELLTGRLPWTDNRAESRQVLPDLTTVPVRLRRVVGRCLAFDPAQRPAGAAEVARELAAMVAGVQHRTRRRSAAVAAGFGVVLLAAIGIGATNPTEQLGESPAPTPVTARELTAADYFHRGLDRLRRGEFEAAHRDFNSSDLGRPDHRAKVYMAYCLARLKRYQDAVMMARAAIKAGADTPAVWNILGFSELYLGRHSDAITHLGMALERDPGYWPAVINRVMARSNSNAPDQAVPDVDYLRSDDGPRSVQLSRLAADIYVRAAAKDESLRPKVAAALADAIRLGEPREKLLNNRLFKPYFEEFPFLVQVPVDPPASSQPWIDYQLPEPGL